MAAETGFMIDGTRCEFPSLDSFSMDEAQVLYDYSGIVIEDFAPSEDAEPNEQGEYELDDAQAAKLKNPGFMRALLHIAYQRKHPKMNTAKVKALIGAVNIVELLEQLAQQDVGDDAVVPPASTTEPDESSPNGSVESNESSGDVSPTSSDPPVVRLAPTTTTESDTSSTLAPTGSGA